MSAKRTRNFCFTWNNYTESQLELLDKIEVTYLVYGFEEAPTTGTKHLQGFVVFPNAKTHSAVCKLFTGAHVEVAKGGVSANYTYVTKTGKFKERGIKPLSAAEKGSKEKDRWDAAYSCARTGDFDSIDRKLYIQYYSTFKRIRREDGQQHVPTEIVELFSWQSQLKDELLGPPHSRRIIWYYDPIGGSGKTEFSNYMVGNHGATVLANGSSRDIAYALPDAPTIVIFDYTRDVEERLNYSILEAVKNGRVFSSKYESTTRHFKKPHVVVFANFRPDQSKLSADRWDIRQLSEEFVLKQD